MAQSSVVVKRTAYSSLAVFLAFAVAYVPLLFLLGYGYELHVASTVVFAMLSVLITLGLFRSQLDGFEGLSRIKIVFAILVCLVLVEELLLNSIFAMYGLALSIFGLVSLPVLAVVLGRDNGWLRVALESVALIFATRVVLSPFQVGFLSLPTFIPTIYTLILIGLILYLTYRGIPARGVRISLGGHSVGLQLGAGFGVGAILGVVEYFVLRPGPILVGVGFFQMLTYIVVVLAVMVGVVEEVLFRGLLQGSLERIMPGWQAIGVASVMFGLMHVGWMNPLEVLLAYGAGVVFGCMAMVTDSLIAPITAHGFGNLVLYLIALHPL
ncbi:MAG: CPBP family intramembrane metalloprotease [Candidatus Brockarchaeota archaeon]|nr:CPBP family intramembrane metalloprotease [Candidatus Brockarchaeota archaeon]